MRTDRRGSLGLVPTLVLDPMPAAFEELLEQRRRLDQDRRDEVWVGVLHMIPPPSHAHERLVHQLHVILDPYAADAGLEITGTVGIGVESDHRVPDLAMHRPGAAPQWHSTAALVAEVVSPGDKTWEKLPFYATHGVDELLIVDHQQRRVTWLALSPDREYAPIGRSALLEFRPEELAERLGWSS
jgi:hypothetical protein